MSMQLNLENRPEGKCLILYRNSGVNGKLTSDMGGIPPNLYCEKQDNLASSF